MKGHMQRTDGGGAVVTQGVDGEGAVATQGVNGEGAVATQGVNGEGAVVTQFPGRALKEVTKYNGNHMPHWTKNGVVYHISFRLFDSVPVAKRMEWEESRRVLDDKWRKGEILSEDELREMKYLYSANIESYLDSGYGECILRNDGALAVVRDTLMHDNGKKYRIHAFGIMPNHVHIIVEFPEASRMPEVLQQWKSVSAHRLNHMLGRKGEVWQTDSYNHIIRTSEEYKFQMNYVVGKNAVVGAWRWVVDGEGAVVTQGGRS